MDKEKIKKIALSTFLQFMYVIAGFLLAGSYNTINTQNDCNEFITEEIFIPEVKQCLIEAGFMGNALPYQTGEFINFSLVGDINITGELNGSKE